VLTLRQRATTPTLDALEWPADLAIEAYGLSIGVRASHRSLLDPLERILPPGGRFVEGRQHTLDAQFSLVVARTPEHSHRLFEDAGCVASGGDLHVLIGALESRLHFRIAVDARTRLFVHAGVVGWKGGAILLPGRSGAGKTSLVAGLVRAGASYYSDEYAVLDEQGHVYPFPRALGVRDAENRVHHVSPEALGAEIGTLPLPIRAVVVTRHVLGATWSPRPISGGQAVLALLANTIAARTRRAEALSILCTASIGATAICGYRGDAACAAEEILSSATPVEELSWKHRNRAIQERVTAGY
jgi:hypothetical protein